MISVSKLITTLGVLLLASAEKSKFSMLLFYSFIMLTLIDYLISSKTSALQDLQLYFNCGIGQWANAVHSKGYIDCNLIDN